MEERKLSKAALYQIYREACALAAAANPKLKRPDLYLYQMILSFTYQTTVEARRSVVNLAWLLGVSKSTVLRSLEKLRKEAHIRRTLRWDTNCEQDISKYEPLLPKSAEHVIRRRYNGESLTFLLSVMVDPDEVRDRVEHESLTRKCYRLARQRYGSRGASLVAKALGAGTSEEELLQELAEAHEVGEEVDDFAYRVMGPLG